MGSVGSYWELEHEEFGAFRDTLRLGLEFIPARLKVTAKDTLFCFLFRFVAMVGAVYSTSDFTLDAKDNGNHGYCHRVTDYRSECELYTRVLGVAASNYGCRMTRNAHLSTFQ